jgi:hypothetical protein
MLLQHLPHASSPAQNPEPCHAQIELIEGVNKHVFGEGLDVVEQQWLVSEINGWLEGSRGSPVDIDVTEDRAQVPLPAAGAEQ